MLPTAERRGFHHLRFDRFLARVDTMPTTLTVIVASMFGAIVAGFDLATGSELSVSIFYVGPVALVAWRVGRLPGLVTAVIAAAVWFVADQSSDATYSRALIPVWNAVVRFGFFAIIAAMTASLHAVVSDYADEARVDELTGALNRRGFTERASVEIERARRFGRPLTLAFIDLDDFGDLLADVNAVLDLTGADPSMLELELTESQLLEDLDRATQVLDALRAKGIRIAIDDFGTGYSSMTYLRELPIDAVKIDRSFVARATEHGYDSTVIDALLTIGRALGLSVVAEGIESEAQLAYMSARGCDRAQGFLLARPMPVEDAELVLFEHGPSNDRTTTASMAAAPMAATS